MNKQLIEFQERALKSTSSISSFLKVIAPSSLVTIINSRGHLSSYT